MAKNDKSAETAAQGPWGPYAPWGQPPVWAGAPAPWAAGPAAGFPGGAPHWPWPGPWGQGAHPETPHHDPSMARGPQQQPHSHDTAAGGCSSSSHSAPAESTHSCGSSSSHSHSPAPQGGMPFGPGPQGMPYGPIGYGGAPQGYYGPAPQGYGSWGSSWTQHDWTRGWLHFQNPTYIKGMIVGAVAAAVITNPTAQKKTMQTLASIWGMLQGGVEELKERFRDMEAEMEAAARAAADKNEGSPPSKT